MACTGYDDAAKGDIVKALLNYIVSPEGQDAAASNAGSAPISDQIRSQIQPAVDAIGSYIENRERTRPSVHRSIDTTTNAGQLLASASGGPRRHGDRIFSNLAVAAGVAILALLAGVAIFLVVQALPAITASASELPDGKTLVDYIGPLVYGTVLAAILAVVIAVPMAIAVALFISHIAPKRLAQPLGYIVDLLAAIPSIVYGLWGIAVLGPATVPVTQWLTDHLSFIPFFAGPASVTGRTMFTIGIVLALMILPIVSAVAREVFTQTPKKLQEGATGARRDPLGDDPDDRPAVRQVGADQRLDARTGAGAGRDDGRRDHPLGLGGGDA